MTTWLVAACLALWACGGATVPSPSPSRPITPPTATAAATASAAPTALSSANGLITVSRPQPNSRVSSPVTISGDASVFEAALQWRITDSAGRVIAQGIATASAGGPGRGTYSVNVTFAPPASDTIGIVEVFSRSPRDGSVDEIVRLPVVISR